MGWWLDISFQTQAEVLNDRTVTKSAPGRPWERVSLTYKFSWTASRQQDFPVSLMPCVTALEAVNSSTALL